MKKRQYFQNCLIAFLVVILSCKSPEAKTDPAKNDSTSGNLNKDIGMGHPRITKNYDSTKVEQVYPFTLYHDGTFMIAAEIESAPLQKYLSLFEKNGFTGNGYTWEGVIRQFLAKDKPGLISHINFDPEAGGFYCFADSEESQREFVVVLGPIFSDIGILEARVKALDRSKIDD